MTTEHRCIDCIRDRDVLDLAPPKHVRPAPHPGPRCATHWGKEKQRRKKADHERRVQRTYGLKPGEYDRLYEMQGGRCALCQRAKGVAKKLAVDHDHSTGRPRGLLCTPCNKGVLGQARDDVGFFVRCIAYLTNPPYKQLNKGTPHGMPPVWQGDEADEGR